MLSIEKGIIFESKERLEFISDLAKKVGKNSLILFSDVKNGYGKMIQSKLLEWNPNTFYIDGEVDSKDRDRFLKILENPNDCTLFEFDDVTIKVHQYSLVELSNGKSKLAKDITLDDDVSDNWIKINAGL
jgi:hypothetical protein